VTNWTIVNDGQLCDLSYDNGQESCGEIASEQVGRYRVCRQCADFLRSMSGVVRV
jgi:hypothetical protein